MTNKALEINNLDSHIGDFSLSCINFSIEKGTIMSFIGKNGSGKTTLIKTILNMIPKASGEVLFNGISMFGNEETVKAKIGVVFDTLIYPLNLKPTKIKKMISPFYKTFDCLIFDELMERFELDPNKKLLTYSKGMQMKFGIVMALCHSPDLIILNEPTAGLDPIARAAVIDLLLDLIQNDQRSILFSTHITSDLEKIADYITMIDNGKIIFSKGKDEMLDTYLLAHIEREAMTDVIKSELIGIKETTFGYEGLCTKILKLQDLAGVKTVRPTIEDIMVYMGTKKRRLKERGA
ncbi:ABC transporter ATP-binding protein [Clostridium estertheticum]|uniref:ABC transporter ATP-binding protein n=1 Tax=Clostridium estertheticum TaxID=238834 RepID=UPI001C6E337C|nr:ABC transporter ATP-binding protein [Clostridium estertheticum]MBW9152051.1 ABC transporter ATP-binding protein [Clostridium estertheticum]WLC85082.1 ABC transporter ATP-binding protein [Clostridium estertheticum]